MDEIWKSIINYEGIYEVSNTGKIRSLNRINHKGTHFKGKELKLSSDTKGYSQIWLSKNGKQHIFLVHRIVALHFLNNEHNLPQVNHIDEDKSNNNVHNLEWCTNYDNSIKHRELHNKPNTGIHWNTNNQRFILKLRDKYIDSFKTKEEAIAKKLEILNPSKGGC